MSDESGPGSRRRVIAWEALLLAALAALGFWFRWSYARHVSFFVDEYLTARAAARILELGLPLLPSGNYYSHGQLLSYVEALLLALGGGQAWLMRLPVVLLSTAALPLTWWFGRRLFSPAAGLIAAALLAVAPEAILWGGRVRMYAPLQFFALLAAVLFYFWVIRRQDRALYRLLFVLAYWAALLCHAEAMLLLPIWGLWALLQRGWRWCLRPANLLTFAFSGLAPLVEILLRRLGPPVQARVAPGVLEPLARRYLGSALDWPGVQKVLEPTFLTPARLPLTILLIAGGLYLLAAWLRARRRGAPAADRARQDLALAYLYALLLPALFLLLFVTDPEWKSPRYVLMLLPFAFLLGGGLLVRQGRWLAARWGRGVGQGTAAWGALTLALLLIVAAFWSPALAATRESVPGYDWALAYVAEHQQPGEPIITFLCPAAFFHLGRCDYLAIPSDFSGFAMQRDGRWVSGWDEVPILDTGAGLRQVLSHSPGAWFVVDEGRFPSRYDADFVQAVWGGMDLVAAREEMLVFRARQPLPAGAGRQRPIDFQDGITLLGYERSPAEPQPGDDLLLALLWQARAPVGGGYTAFVHLLDESGRLCCQVDRPPFAGLYPTWRWRPGPILPDRVALPLPADLAPGRYRLLAGLYDTASGERLPLEGGGSEAPALDYVWIGPRPAVPAPQVALDATLGGAVELLGYDLLPLPGKPLAPGGQLALTLYWWPLTPLDQDYTVFVHLLDEQGQIAGQVDGPPLAGSYPTSYWQPGEVLLDHHDLLLDAAAPPGTYCLLVGFYTLADGQRLPAAGAAAAGPDSLLLALLPVR